MFKSLRHLSLIPGATPSLHFFRLCSSFVLSFCSVDQWSANTFNCLCHQQQLELHIPNFSCMYRFIHINYSISGQSKPVLPSGIMGTSHTQPVIFNLKFKKLKNSASPLYWLHFKCWYKTCPSSQRFYWTVLFSNWRGSRPAGSGVVAAIYKYTWTTEILWRKRDSMATR